MSFLYPNFLFALFAIAIPILIHLFYFRRYKTVYFSNISFLKEVKDEKSSRNKLKHLLVLLCRILLIAFLVIAFAQPTIFNNKNTTASGAAVSIYIDNSFSMLAENEEMPLLEQAKQLAEGIVAAYPEGTEFHFCTNDLNGLHQRLSGKDDVLNFISDVKGSSSPISLKRINQKQYDILSSAKSKNRQAYLISDFQKTAGLPQLDSAVQLHLIPLKAVQSENIWIDSAWLPNPVQLNNQECLLLVKMKRRGGNTEVPALKLNLQINGQSKALTEVQFGERMESIDSLRFICTEAGWYDAKISIQDHPITYDDDYFFSFPVLDKLNVLCIQENGNSQYLDAFYKNEKLFNYQTTEAGQINYNLFGSSKLILLSQLSSVSSGLASELKQSIENGANLVVFPSEKADLQSYNKLFSSLDMDALQPAVKTSKEVLRVDVQDPLWKDVFDRFPSNIRLPESKLSFPVSTSNKTSRMEIMNFSDGNPFLLRYSYGAGKIFLFSSPLNTEFTDLPKHGLFAPLLYKFAITASIRDEYTYTLSPDTRFRINSSSNGEHPYILSGNGLEIIPSQRSIGRQTILGIQNQISQSGIYKLSRKEDTSEWHLALNYARSESILECFGKEELLQQLGEGVDIQNGNVQRLEQDIRQNTIGIPLWKYFIMLALIMLLLEVLLLRFWK